MRQIFALWLAAAVFPAAAQMGPSGRAPGWALPAPPPDEVRRLSPAPASTLPETRSASALAELVERAWVRERAAAIRDARAGALDARADAARAAFPESPSIGFDLRRDLPSSVRLPGTETAEERGRNELEPRLSVPLWLPGQRDGQRRVIGHERDRLEAATRVERLRLTGELREAAWANVLARAEARVQQARLDSARALEADVVRRIAAGELAPVDRLLARTESLAAVAALHEASAREAQAVAELRRLAGVEVVGEIEETPADARLNEDHPVIAVLREAVEAARARLDLARVMRRDSPTLSAAARFDRDAHGTPYRNTVRIGITVPLDTEARNAPRIAAASAELTEAEVGLERQRRMLEVAVERARASRDSARAVLAVNTARAASAAEASAAIERAFRGGERGLPELLRVRALAFEAERALEVARLQLGLATARLNQALGVHP